MNPTKKYLPADFNQQELYAASEILAVIVKEMAKDFWPLAAMLHGLQGDIVKEMQLKLAGDDPAARDKLLKLWNEKHSQ